MFKSYPMSCQTCLSSFAICTHLCWCRIFFIWTLLCCRMFLVAMWISHHAQVVLHILSFWWILISASWDHNLLLIMLWANLWLTWWSFRNGPWYIPSINSSIRLPILSYGYSFSFRSSGETAAMILFLIACWQFLQMPNWKRFCYWNSWYFYMKFMLTLFVKMNFPWVGFSELLIRGIIICNPQRCFWSFYWSSYARVTNIQQGILLVIKEMVQFSSKCISNIGIRKIRLCR